MFSTMSSTITKIARIGSLLLLFSISLLPGNTISLTGLLDPDDPNSYFVYEFSTASPSRVVAQSWGFGGGINSAGTAIEPGGFDSYLTLFSGWGPEAPLLFINGVAASNDDGPCTVPASPTPCRDPYLALDLPSGNYSLVLTVFGNMSIAENYGTGVLGDGFTGFGSYFSQDDGSLRESRWALDVTQMETPEPSTALLLCSMIPLGCYLYSKRRKSNDSHD